MTWTILVFVNLLQYCFWLSGFLCFGFWPQCGILAPGVGIEPCPLHWKAVSCHWVQEVPLPFRLFALFQRNYSGKTYQFEAFLLVKLTFSACGAPLSLLQLCPHKSAIDFPLLLQLTQNWYVVFPFPSNSVYFLGFPRASLRSVSYLTLNCLASSV